LFFGSNGGGGASGNPRSAGRPLWTAERFARIDRAAALLLAPYALWVGCAAVLTAAIWLNN